MNNVLVYVDTRHGKVQPIAFELLAAARAISEALDSKVEALVVGDLEDGEIASLGAADRILSASHPALAPYIPEAHASVLASVIKERHPAATLIAYTSAGLDLGPAASLLADVPLVSYCRKLTVAASGFTAICDVYGGKLEAAVETPVGSIFAIVPGTYREGDGRLERPQEVELLTLPEQLEAISTAFVEETTPASDEIDLTQATCILCVGRGIGASENIDAVRKIADQLGAAIAGSRPVIDAGWLPKAHQVGKSGTKVSPKIYVALGVSGAPEHLEGISSSELIIAVNTDPAAPIFSVAHYGTTCDMFALLPALNELLSA